MINFQKVITVGVIVALASPSFAQSDESLSAAADRVAKRNFKPIGDEKMYSYINNAAPILTAVAAIGLWVFRPISKDKALAKLEIEKVKAIEEKRIASLGFKDIANQEIAAADEQIGRIARDVNLTPDQRELQLRTATMLREGAVRRSVEADIPLEREIEKHMGKRAFAEYKYRRAAQFMKYLSNRLLIAYTSVETLVRSYLIVMYPEFNHGFSPSAALVHDLLTYDYEAQLNERVSNKVRGVVTPSLPASSAAPASAPVAEPAASEVSAPTVEKAASAPEHPASAPAAPAEPEGKEEKP